MGSYTRSKEEATKKISPGESGTTDRKITISIGNNRWSTQWQPSTMTVAELYDRLSRPQRGRETFEEYFKLPKRQQDQLKDIGGFVGGTLNGTQRKACNVTGRDVISLDFDNIPGWKTEDFQKKVSAIGCSYCIYSTRKHTPAAPRLRVVIPLNRTCSADEYEPIARRLASYIGIEMADPTTFDVSRLMYWPSCCSDSQFYFYSDLTSPLADVDKILKSYENWRDIQEWPIVPNAKTHARLAAQQGDPESKSGIVGAFCRTYNIYSAMETYLPGIYEQCGNDSERFTFLGGSTTGGAVVYEGGKFLFSHHATDPCGGRLVNAFDLVRLHKYGQQDAEAAPETPVCKLPSYKAMSELAMSDKRVVATLNREQIEQVAKDFEGLENAETPEDWMEGLQRNKKTGEIKGTIDNVLIILDGDPQLKDKFALNEFANRGEVFGALPWDANPKRRPWTDTDNNGLYWYLEKYYHITSRGNIDSALDVHSAKHKFNDVQRYIEGLHWDGQKRLDTLLIDCLEAEDSAYTRAVTRKAFTAAVARAMEPGCKFDNMLILAGPQGAGKSSLIGRMSRGWFNDSIRTFEGKEASELLQGVWLVEVAELDAFRRTDIARIKQFLSLRADRYRAAYGRHVKELPRCCVFFGTCNETEFLQDTTGNRRFWPVDVKSKDACKVNNLDDETVNQLWAEAKTYWQLGEPLYLTGEVEAAAKIKQEAHREASVREGLIAEFAEREIPEDWDKWEMEERRTFWSGNAHTEAKTVPRDKITAIEVWCELFNGAPKDLDKRNTREINAILANLPGWVRYDKTMRAGPYRQQRGFKRESK